MILYWYVFTPSHRLVVKLHLHFPNVTKSLLLITQRLNYLSFKCIKLNRLLKKKTKKKTEQHTNFAIEGIH